MGSTNSSALLPLQGRSAAEREGSRRTLSSSSKRRGRRAQHRVNQPLQWAGSNRQARHQQARRRRAASHSCRLLSELQPLLFPLGLQDWRRRGPSGGSGRRLLLLAPASEQTEEDAGSTSSRSDGSRCMAVVAIIDSRTQVVAPHHKAHRAPPTLFVRLLKKYGRQQHRFTVLPRQRPRCARPSLAPMSAVKTCPCASASLRRPLQAMPP